MISLIVPVYNVELYLERCVSSILAQTYKEFELILVNDGSTDGSSAQCEFYGKQDKRIKVIYKENGGAGSARKAGLAAAQGEYVGFVDGDDWIEPQMYEHLVEAAIGHQADMVLGGYIEDVNGQTAYKSNRLKQGVYDKGKLQKEVYPNMLCMEDFFCMGVHPYIWNKLMRRELAYEYIMAVDDRIHVGEDVAAIIPMLLKADKVVITDYFDYHYCVRGTSTMQRYGNMEKEWEWLCILHKFLREVFQQNAEQSSLGYQLNHYTVSNMLTRTYAGIAEKNGGGTLWPFNYRLDSGRKCIVYSAGNFGRQVYVYLQNYHPGSVILWVDQKYQMYQSLGMPVYSVEDVVEEKNIDILIAVLDTHLAGVIREDLLQAGVGYEQIYSINITDDDIREMLGSV